MTGSLVGATIATGCGQINPASVPPVPCQSVGTQAPGGVADVLKVNGVSVLLETIEGESVKGDPKKDWKAKDAGQSVLRSD